MDQRRLGRYLLFVAVFWVLVGILSTNRRVIVIQNYQHNENEVSVWVTDTTDPSTIAVSDVDSTPRVPLSSKSGDTAPSTPSRFTVVSDSARIARFSQFPQHDNSTSGFLWQSPRVNVFGHGCLANAHRIRGTISPLPATIYGSCRKKTQYFQRSDTRYIAALLGRPHDGGDPNRPDIVVIVIDSLSRAEVVQIFPQTTRILTTAVNKGIQHCIDARGGGTSRFGPETCVQQAFPMQYSVSTGGGTREVMASLLGGKYPTEAPLETDIWLHSFAKKLGYSTSHFQSYHCVGSCSFQSMYFDEGYPGWDRHLWQCRYPWMQNNTQVSTPHLLRGWPTFHPHTKECNEFHTKHSQIAITDNSMCVLDDVHEEASLHLGSLAQLYRDEATRATRRPLFTVMHLMRGHYPSNPRTYAYDDSVLADTVSALMSNNHTIVLLMSDHGSVHSEIPESYALPFAFFWIPYWWTGGQSPDAAMEMRQRLDQNRQRLTSALDYYYTLIHLMRGNNPRSNTMDTSEFDSLCFNSLLNRVHAFNRTCEEAGVVPEVCPCRLDDWEIVTQVNPVLWSTLRGALAMMHARSIRGATQRVGLGGRITYVHVPSGVAARCPTIHVAGIVPYRLISSYLMRVDVYTSHGRLFSVVVRKSTTVVSVSQTTSYHADEQCTPRGANPMVCFCSGPGNAVIPKHALLPPFPL